MGFYAYTVEIGVLRAHIAQLVEHVLGKDEVNGSIPFVGSKKTGPQGSKKRIKKVRRR